LKIALVTFNFDPLRPGGVNSVVMRVHEMIKQNNHANVDIFSFSNARFDANSISFSRAKTYRNSLVASDGFFQNSSITRVGTIGSEFEFLRYRKRFELSNLFKGYDLIIVVTGIIQFANVIPRVDVPVLVQCATRLQWERESLYKTMGRVRRALLRLQLPLLSWQEKRVLRSQMIFMVENSRMQKWIANKTSRDPEMWYPGIGVRTKKLESTLFPNRNGHFISVGRLNENRKGWERLFLAYKKAFDSFGGLPELVIIGAGNFHRDTQELLDKLSPNYPIRVLGKLSDYERDIQIQSASYFLQASYEEGLGLAALEALSFGVPLICSETDGSREYVIDGVSGTLVAQGDDFITDFANAIIESQNWDYSVLQASSILYFNTVFTNEICQKRLMIIINKIVSEAI
jgi:glycosyltransferase involved in cell wall biosynthesis